MCRVRQSKSYLRYSASHFWGIVAKPSSRFRLTRNRMDHLRNKGRRQQMNQVDFGGKGIRDILDFRHHIRIENNCYILVGVVDFLLKRRNWDLCLLPGSRLLRRNIRDICQSLLRCKGWCRFLLEIGRGLGNLGNCRIRMENKGKDSAEVVELDSCLRLDNCPGER